MHKILLIAFCLMSLSGFGQNEPSISGDESVYVGSWTPYYVNWTNGEPGNGNYYWYSSSGTILAPTASSCQARWEGPGYATLFFDYETWNNYYSASYDVFASLAPPQNTGATLVQTTSFRANWSSVFGASSYKLYVSTNSSFTTYVTGYAGVSVTGTYKDVTGLSPGATYYYRVRAATGSDMSVNSAVAAVHMQLLAPVINSATSIASNSFSISWNTVAGATGYRLDVSTSSSFSSFVSGYNNLTVSTNSKSVTGLTPGTTYYVRVRAANSYRNSPNSGTATALTLPAAPAIHSATAITANSFTASWGSVLSASGYRLDVSTNSAFSSFVAGYQNLSLTTTSRSITGLSPGVTYYYRARAVNATGVSSNSGTASAVTVPGVPVLAGPSVVTTSSFTASWAAVTGATGYRLDVSADGFATFVSGYNNLLVSATSKNVTGLASGATYSYRIRATNASGSSPNSTTRTVTLYPGPPTAMAPTNVTSTSFTANWSASSGATGYRLDVSTNSAFSGFVRGYQDLSLTTTSRSITGLSAGVTYYYRVRAVNAAGASSNSGTASTVTLPNVPLLDGPSAVTTSSFTASWTAVTGATSYRLDVSTDGFATFVDGYSNLVVSGTSKNVTGLASGAPYSYRVRASNAAGSSPNSATRTVTLYPTPPTAVAPTNVTATSFTANWQASSGATGYRLDVSTDDNFASFVPGYNNLLVAGINKNVTGLSPNTTYYYRLRAENAAGMSVNSTVVSKQLPPLTPTAKAATNVTMSSFVASWTPVAGATGYQLSISDKNDFSAYLSGYDHLALTGTNKEVTGLDPGATVYYKVQALNESSTSAYSNTITVGVAHDHNYIRITSATIEGLTTLAAIESATKEQATTQYSFFDGLGRPIQNITKEGSPLGNDVVQPVVYDEFGREARKYLPFVANETTGWFKEDIINTLTGAYQNGAIDFYNNLNDVIADDATPWSETIFEASPLDRVLEQGAPGADWQPGTGHAIKMAYETNVTDEVLRWRYSPPTEAYPLGLVYPSVEMATYVPVHYYPGQLLKNVTRDEQDHEVIEYKDNQGKVVLKRVQAADPIPGDPLPLDDIHYASTYYIYDDFGQLVCVLPPEATKRLADGYDDPGSTDDSKEAFLERWAFRYRYDERKRMIMKQVPGAEPVFMVYDNRDRLVLTQDGNQRATSPFLWSFTKYDELNRPILTGIKDTSQNVGREEMQAAVDAHYEKSWARWGETFDETGVHGYTNKSYPVTTSEGLMDENHFLTVTYYDDYQFRDGWVDGYSYKDENLSETVNNVLYAQPDNEWTRVTGQVTGSKTKVLDGGIRGGYTWLKTVNYYDQKYRLIQSIGDNYKGGADRITNLYDFTGKVLRTKTTHTTNEISWTGLVNTVLAGNNLRKTTLGAGWTAGGITKEELAAGADGWIECMITDPEKKAFGLTAANEGENVNTIDYAFWHDATTAKFLENGSAKYTFSEPVKPGDVIRIARSGTQVNYYKNGVLLYSSQTPSTSSLVGDACIDSGGGNILIPRASFNHRADSVLRRFVYDHAGRLEEVWHQVNDAPSVRITYNEYNELGQLIDKKLHSSEPAATDAVQSIDYRYNIRGWLTAMNEEDLNGGDEDATDYFSFQLGYNNDIGTGNQPLYNGNISGMKWSSNLGLDDAKMNAYNYTYDDMNRITGAVFKTASGIPGALSWLKPADDSFSESGYSYDLNGNIMGLVRKGKNGSDTDILTYDYGTGDTQSNQLLKVTDAGSKTTGFAELEGEGNDYKYDENGNLVWDKNKGGEELLQNGGFSNGSAGWIITDTGGRLTFANDSLNVVTHATTSATLKQNDILRSGALYVVIVDMDRESGSILFNLGFAGNRSVSASGRTVFNYEAGSGNDFVVTIPETFSGHIKSIEVKGVVVISYNHLNLPETIEKGLQQSLRYIYDASGRKISQEVYDSQGLITKKSDYEGEFFYGNDTLQFINHDEGRVVMTGSEPEYQYNLEDHLGNVRLTFTTKPDVDAGLATLETVDDSEGRSEFLNYDEAIKVNYDLFDHTYNDTTGATYYSTRLTGANTNAVYGLAKSLSVMPGDTIKMEVFAKYLDPDPDNWTEALTNFMAAIAGGGAPAGTVVDGGSAGSIGSGSFPFAGIFDHSSETETAPKAYLNYIVFDRDFNPLIGESGYRRITTASKENGSNVPHDKLEKESLVIKQPGYVYIYLSNENETPVEVYFDDFKVEHIKSPVVQMDDYYPFGLTFNSFQRENSLPQDYKYNGKEEQNELNLGLLDYGARMYQPDLGRFGTQDRFATKYFSTSPYSYVDNNPLLYVDVNGDSINVSNLISKNGKVSQEGLYVLFYMISDLQDITGMNLSVNGNGKIITDGKGGTTGSKKARDYVSTLISDKDDILVKNDNTKDTQGGGRGSVNINSTQIDNNIASANNAGLGELTFGYGMSFLHETVHTAIGTKIINPTATSTIKDNVSTTYPAGPTVAKVNEFRNELGLPERTQYYWTTPSLSVAPTMTWNKAGTPVTMTMTAMSTYDKMIRRMRATALKKK